MGDWWLQVRGGYYGPYGEYDDDDVYTHCSQCGHNARNGYCFYCGAGKRQPPAKDTTNNSAAALRIWSQALPAAGTVVETYLRSRAITLLPDCLRYSPDCYHTETRARWPTMVAARIDHVGNVCAVHRTYLTPIGGKAPIDPQKKDLGPAKGTAIRLSTVAEDLLIGEGIETTLSAMQATGRSGWAAGSARMLQELILPAAVRRIIILADGDATGITHSRAALARWISEGRQARIVYAPAGKDFNYLLIAEQNNA
jgi:hypothetical protein